MLNNFLKILKKVNYYKILTLIFILMLNFYVKPYCIVLQNLQISSILKQIKGDIKNIAFFIMIWNTVIYLTISLDLNCFLVVFKIMKYNPAFNSEILIF